MEHFFTKHRIAYLFYRRIEKTGEFSSCSSLISCYFCCNICEKSFDSFNSAQIHSLKKHPYNSIDFKIFKRIEITQTSDSGQSVKSIRYELSKFSFRQLFYCAHCNQAPILGTLADAITHYNQNHKVEDHFVARSQCYIQQEANTSIDQMTIKAEYSNVHAVYVLITFFETINEFR